MIFITDEAGCCAYVDANNRVCVDYKGSLYSNVAFSEGDSERDNVAVNEIAKIDNITITDTQGFSGQSENMLIRGDDGSYYYNDGDSGLVREIENLDQTYKKAVLLMDENILALGEDGYLYIIENQKF